MFPAHRLPQRRQLLRQLSLGLMAPLAVRHAWALQSDSAGADGRFVLVFLRGGLDGLFAFAPSADTRLSSLRPSLAQAGAAERIALSGSGFAAHSACQGLAGLYAARELLFCPTAGTTDKSRSHFQAQDLFELGSGATHGDQGFMARLADALDADQAGRGAISFTRELPLAFNGAEHPAEVAPLAGSGLKLPEGRVLDSVRRAHFGLKSGEAIDQAIATQAEIEAAVDMDGAARGAISANGFPKIAGHMGRMLRSNRRLCTAFIDLGGFDTHAGEAAILSRVLQNLSDGILALKDGLGADEWARTRVAVMTEFGRTAHENGTQGTDHGHGGLFLLAGGNLSGGRMLGHFDGLADSALNEGRDLPVSADWRDLLGQTLGQMFGLSDAALDQVFPGRPRQKLALA